MIFPKIYGSARYCSRPSYDCTVRALLPYKEVFHNAAIWRHRPWSASRHFHAVPGDQWGIFWKSTKVTVIWNLFALYQLSLPSFISGHTTLKQHRFNVDSRSWRWINDESMLFQCCVPAGYTANYICYSLVVFFPKFIVIHLFLKWYFLIDLILLWQNKHR